MSENHYNRKESEFQKKVLNNDNNNNFRLALTHSLTHSLYNYPSFSHNDRMKKKIRKKKKKKHIKNENENSWFNTVFHTHTHIGSSGKYSLSDMTDDDDAGFLSLNELMMDQKTAQNKIIIIIKFYTHTHTHT